MDRKEVSRKIREAIYDRASEEGGAISKEQMEDAIEKVLTGFMPNTNPWLRPSRGASAPVKQGPTKYDAADGAVRLDLGGVTYWVPVVAAASP
mgnify:CR=1 FL=1